VQRLGAPLASLIFDCGKTKQGISQSISKYTQRFTKKICGRTGGVCNYLYDFKTNYNDKKQIITVFYAVITGISVGSNTHRDSNA